MLRVAEHYAGSDTGRQRRANEDSLLARTPLFVVADGMGGAQAGEVASRIAVECFQNGFEAEPNAEASLAEHARAANARIYDLAQRDAEHAGMGTTLTAVYVGEEEVAIAHVGDSRAYCLRDGELLRLTDDHSLVDELIREGRLTPEEAEAHPQRSIITRALGPEASVEVDTRSFRARAQDIYLLCSDGLTTMVGEGLLAEILRAHERLRDAGEALIAAANEAGGRDNITVILLRLEDVGLAGASAPERHPTIAGAAAVASSTHVLRPRAPGVQSAAQRRPRRLRRVLAPMVVLVILGLLLAGAYVASQSVYFLGTNSRGFVTLYQGLPYELPGGIALYQTDFVSGVGASTLSASRRGKLLDHSLRSESDAASLVRSLELGQLSEG